MIFLTPLVQSFEWDNKKSYDENTKTVTVKNSFLGLSLDKVAEIELKTPLNFKVPRGYQKIAEFEVRNFEDYNNALKQLKLYDLNNNNKEFVRDFDYKYKTYVNISVNDYENVIIKTTGNGTKIYERQLVGSHLELKEKWMTLNSTNINKDDILTIGIFTEVKKGDVIEWIPTFFGIEIEEWATWTESLSVDLVSYYKLNESSGTNTTDSYNGNHGTSSGVTVNITGKIATAYNFTSDTDEVDFGTGVFDFAGGEAFSVSMWVSSHLPEDSTDRDFLSRIQSGSPFDGFEFVFRNQVGTKRFQFEANGNTGDYSANWDFTWTNNNWTSIVLTFDGTNNATLYVNGSQITRTGSSGSFTGTVPSVNAFLGNRDSLNRGWRGGIDEVGIWNRTLSGAEAEQLYNNNSGITFTEDFPEVILISPSNDTYFSTQNINFVANITGTGNPISNVTLFIDGISNETNSSGVDAIYNFSKTIAEGSYNWSILAFNNNSFSTQSETRIFTIDTTLPQINISSPVGTLGYNYVGNSEALNVTFTDTNLDTCWYNYNGTNITIDGCVSGTLNSTQFTLESGNTNLTAYSNDTSGSENSSFINWSYTYFENNRTLNNESFQTEGESFNINVEGATSASLFYNGTEYTTTKSGNNFNRTIQIPIANLGNNSIYWKFDGTTDSFNSSQNVSETVFTLCSNQSYNTTFLNISFKDESDSSIINASIPTSTFEYWLGDGTITKTYTLINNTNNFNYEFCATPNRTLNVDPVIQYKQGSAYPQRIWDPDTQQYTNTTTNQILYLLGVADGLYVTFQVFSGQVSSLIGVDVTGTRIIDLLTTTVAQGTTDAAGIVTFWLNPDFLHTFTFIKTGYVTVIQSIVPTQTLYTVTMAGGTEDEFVNNAEGIQINTLPSGSFLDTNTFYDFTYTINSSILTLDEYGFELFYKNGTSIYSDTDTTSTGGTLDRSLNTTNESKIVMTYYYITNSTRINGTTYWLIYQVNAFSVYNFFNRVETYMSANIFGILGDDEGYFAKAMISILILILVTGTISLRYGLGSEAAVTGLLFGMIFMLNIFNLIPTPDFLTFINLGDFLVFLIAIIAITTIIKEETR